MAQRTAVRFKNSYQNYAPTTIFDVDQATKTLKPYGSGPAFTEAGYQFGQERLVEDPNEFAGYSVGPIINDRAAALAGIKNELNAYQDDTFNETTAAPKRQSAVLQENISKETATLDAALAEYGELRKRRETLTAPNYQQAYEDLRAKQGIPQLEQEFADVRKTRRELPYVQRANTGNAAVATEGQLQAQITENDVPWYIQEANLIDRLKLASEFANNSVALRELDYNASRQSLTDAIALALDAINFSNTRLTNMGSRQDSAFAREDAQDAAAQTRRDTALQFNIDNNINTPAFVVGTQAYDARTLDPISLEQYQQLTGQQVGLPENQTNFGPTLLTRVEGGKQEEKALVLSLIQSYPDAGIAPGDSFVVASSKVKNSRIYQEQVRPPSAGGSGSNVTRTMAQDDIVARARLKFNEQAGSSQDGKVNPNTYRDFKQEYISKGGSPTDFFQMFPIEQYIAPGNQKGDLVQSSNANNVNQEARLQQLLQKSSNGQNLDALSPEEQIELYSLL